MTTAMAPSSSLKKPPTSKASGPFCRHPSSATLDILIFILVVFSGAFLIVSCFSHIFQSLSLILPHFPTALAHLHRHLASNPQSQSILFTLFIVSFVGILFFCEICCGHRSRRCERKGCKGLKKAMELDLHLQGEELLWCDDWNKVVRDVNELPWKGGSEENPDYECLQAELRKMALSNGRAVLLFCGKCGCPVAKLEGWGPKRGRRRKK